MRLARPSQAERGERSRRGDCFAVVVAVEDTGAGMGSESAGAFSIRLRPGSSPQARTGRIGLLLWDLGDLEVVPIVPPTLFFKGDGTECQDHSKLPR